MINVLSDTFRFMSAAGQLDTVGFPADTTDQLRCLRRSLLTEEFHEYRDAEWANDVVEVADGLADVIVIAVGTLFQYFGYAVTEAVLNEVGRSNAAKIVDGKVRRRVDGKVLKPEGWTPPDIAGILRDAGVIE